MGMEKKKTSGTPHSQPKLYTPKPRGIDARAARERSFKANPAKLKNFQEYVTKRLSMCLVCGKYNYDEKGNKIDGISWRSVAGYRIQACDTHKDIVMTPTLRGYARFHEVASNA